MKCNNAGRGSMILRRKQRTTLYSNNNGVIKTCIEIKSSLSQGAECNIAHILKVFHILKTYFTSFQAGEITAKMRNHQTICQCCARLMCNNWFFICTHSLFSLLRRKLCIYKTNMIQSLVDFKPRYKNKTYRFQHPRKRMTYC